jgi:RND family efflux transporter MFP subunit
VRRQFKRTLNSGQRPKVFKMKLHSALHYRASRVKSLSALFLAMAMSALLLGCTNEPPPVEHVARAVKIEEVSCACESTLQFVGAIRQSERSDLSFESRGRITRIDVEIGDVVKRGQQLAALEPAPAKLRAAQAEASVSAAQAQLAERKLQLDQQQALYADGTTSAITIEAARTAYQIAASQLQQAQANLALALREVKNSVIVAPFDGRIVGRAAQAFSDVAEGQLVIQMEGRAQQEIVAMLPTTLAGRLHPGMRAVASLEDKPSAPVTILVKQISSRAENGSLVQAIFRIEGRNPWLDSGMTVNVQIPNPAGEGFLSVPSDALMMGSSGRNAQVFIYDSQKGRVNKRAIVLGEFANGRVQVQKGLVPGELVVAAGPQFLLDGDAVTLYKPATRFAQGM